MEPKANVADRVHYFGPGATSPEEATVLAADTRELVLAVQATDGAWRIETNVTPSGVDGGKHWAPRSL